jgi:hypothetical protein
MTKRWVSAVQRNLVVWGATRLGIARYGWCGEKQLPGVAEGSIVGGKLFNGGPQQYLAEQVDITQKISLDRHLEAHPSAFSNYYNR